MIDISVPLFVFIIKNRGGFENGGGFGLTEKHVVMMDGRKHRI